MIWLHVIEYNKSAIRFYEKNKFAKFRKLKRHYNINDTNFDAILLYRPIGRLRPARRADEESAAQQRPEFQLPDLSASDYEYSDELAD